METILIKNNTAGYLGNSSANGSVMSTNALEASGENSFSFGLGTRAISPQSVAFGEDTIAGAEGDTKNAFAHGSDTIASGKHSHAEGHTTTASGYIAHSEGNNTIAGGKSSHSEGIRTETKGEGTHTEGRSTIAEGACSHAEGLKSISIGDYSHSEGVNTCQSTGYGSHAEGDETIASGAVSHSEGYRTIALGQYSHAEGQNTVTLGQHSHAEGHSSKRAIGIIPDLSTETPVSDVYSTWGDNKNFSLSYGASSLCSGFNTLSIGDYAHTEGVQTVALGIGSHSEGNNTIVEGDYAHAEGNETEANALGTHAEGYRTKTDYSYSHVEGIGTIATREGQHVSGSYNQEEGTEDCLLVIGKGTDESNRSNALTLNDQGLLTVTDIKLPQLNESDITFTESLRETLQNLILSIHYLEERVRILENK